MVGEETAVSIKSRRDRRRKPPRYAHISAPGRRLGALAGTVFHMAPDFDAPLGDFEDGQERKDEGQEAGKAWTDGT